MKFRTVVGLFILLMSCFGNQQALKSGLVIENKINRGISYTDPQGTDYSIRYIPITIANDSTIPIHLQIAFSKEYNNPHPYSEEKFKLIPLPMEWAIDGSDISERMIDKLPSYIENPVLNETIEPGARIVFAIGSIYPRPAKSTGVLPRTLFVLGKSDIFTDCDWLMDIDRSNQHIPMGLKIIFGEKCTIIPCGQISYPEP